MKRGARARGGKRRMQLQYVCLSLPWVSTGPLLKRLTPLLGLFQLPQFKTAKRLRSRTRIRRRCDERRLALVSALVFPVVCSPNVLFLSSFLTRPFPPRRSLGWIASNVFTYPVFGDGTEATFTFCLPVLSLEEKNAVFCVNTCRAW